MPQRQMRETGILCPYCNTFLLSNVVFRKISSGALRLFHFSQNAGLLQFPETRCSWVQAESKWLPVKQNFLYFIMPIFFFSRRIYPHLQYPRVLAYTVQWHSPMKIHKERGYMVNSASQNSVFLHMLELRWRAFYFGISFICTFLLSTLYSTPLTHLICTPFSSGMENSCKFIFTHVTEGLYATLQVSFMCALSFCVPLLIYQVYSFLMPSCYQGERVTTNLIIFSMTLLFLISLCMAFLFVLPKIFAFLQQFQHQGKCLEITFTARIGPAVQWSCTIFFLTTLFFQMPVFLFLLLHWGVVHHSFLREKRKYALFSLLLGASFICPPDVSGQCVFTIAGCFLYELGIWCALFYKNWGTISSGTLRL